MLNYDSSPKRGLSISTGHSPVCIMINDTGKLQWSESLSYQNLIPDIPFIIFYIVFFQKLT